MNPENFCYWLQGFFEIKGIGTTDDKEGVSPDQAKIIAEHLNLVFKKETSPRNEIKSDEFKKKLLEKIPSPSVPWNRPIC
jgi:hypothetical protein